MHYYRHLPAGKLLPAVLLLVGVFSFAVVPARAQLSFTISPVDGHADQYTVTVNVGSFTTPPDGFQTTGSITADSVFFANSAGVFEPITGGSITTFSSGAPPEPAVVNMAISGANLSFQFGDAGVMGSGTGYGMTGSATSTFSAGAGNTTFSYADLIPGTYNIISGGGAFSPSQNYGGTLTIEAAAIPEPATYAGVLALVSLGFVVWRRRNVSEARSR